MRANRHLALAVLVGVTCGVLGACAWPTGAAVAVAAVAWAVGTDRPGLRRGLVLVACGAAAAALGARAHDRAIAPPLRLWIDQRSPAGGDPEGVIARVEGRLVADATTEAGGARLVLDLDRVAQAGAWQPLEGRLQLFVAGAFAPAAAAGWTRGRLVRTVARVRVPPAARNPGGPSLLWQALIRRADAAGTVKSALLVEVEPGPRWEEWAARLRAAVRHRAGLAFAAGPSYVPPIVTAVLIGDRATLDAAVVARLQAAGTYHVLAISGGNVAWLAVLAFAAAACVTRSARGRAVTTGGIVAAYGWVVGADPSVTRAVLAATVYFGCTAFGLMPAAVDVLLFVAVLIALCDPLAVVNAGVWLTFGATAGILLVMTRRRPTASAAAGASPRHWSNAARDLLVASLAAELALLPVNTGVFTRVSVAGPLLNFVAVPAMVVVQVAGGLAVALVGLLSAVARPVAAVAAAAAVAIAESARLVERLPWLSWRVPPPSLAAVACYYAAAIWWCWAAPRRRLVAVAALAATAAWIVTAPAIGWSRPARGWLRLTMFDVGQGESMLIQLPGGHALLVDAGPRTSGFDAGDRTVVPGVWASGERRLTWLAVSHADLDHIGGAPAVVGALRPGEVWEGVPVPGDPRRRALADLAAAGPLGWRQVQRGDRLSIGRVVVDVLSPPPADWERPAVRNNDSIVLRVRYGDVECLLTGDVDAAVERTLAIETDAAIRVLKVGHHGSRSSTSASLVRAFAPHVALVSAGQGNPFGHPADEVLARLREAGARVFRTDRDGAVTVETDGDAVEVRTSSGRRWGTRAWRRPA